MQAATPEAFQLLFDGSLALARVEGNGIRIDMDYLDRIDKEITQKIAEGKAELARDDVAKIWRKKFGDKTKFSSSQQLAKILYGVLGIPCTTYTEKGSPSTDKNVLQRIDLPFLKIYERVKTLENTKNTFLKNLRKETIDGFFHPNFNLHTATTFRSSSGTDKDLGDFGSSINFQNLPVRNPEKAEMVRRAFIPRKGRQIVENDLAGIEVKIAYVYHLDPTMKKYLEDPTSDMHKDMGAQCYMLERDQVSANVRYCAKNRLVFPEFYGSVYFQCAPALWDSMDSMQLRILNPGDDPKKPTGKLVKEHLAEKGITELGKCDPKVRPVPGTYEHHIKRVEDDLWNSRFPVYTQWKKKWWRDYVENGYFYNKTGFVFRWGKGGPMRRNDALNYPIQSVAFQCLLWAIIRIDKWLRKHKMKTLLVGQVHDSIIADCHPKEVDDYLWKVKKTFSEDLPKHWDWIVTRLEVEAEVSPVDHSWADKKVVKIP